MPRMKELALHTLTTAYTPPTCSTWAGKWYYYDEPHYCPYPFMPGGLPRDPRDRPALLCTPDATFPPWVYGPAPRYCRRCHTIVYYGHWASDGLCKGSCYCLYCAAVRRRSMRLLKTVKARRSWAFSDNFRDLPRAERLAYLDETDRLDRAARRLSRPVPPPFRVLSVPAYWHAPRPDDRAAPPLPRIIPHHIKGSSRTFGALVYNPQSRPWKRFISSLKAPAPATYDAPGPLP